jgi:signal peptidase I
VTTGAAQQALTFVLKLGQLRVEGIPVQHSRRNTERGRRLLLPLQLVAGIACLGISTAIAGSVLVLHLGIHAVLSGSMRPAYQPGVAVITKPVSVHKLHPGMVVLFVPPGEHVEFAHRITSVVSSSADPIITTKGDANRAPDAWHARMDSATIPQVVGTVPWLGNLMARLASVRLVIITAGGLCAAIFGALLIVHPRRRTSELVA